MNNYEEYAHFLASAAQKAVLFEASAAPKPGLVDRFGQGAHKDMDIFTFMASASSIYKGMYQCALQGIMACKDGPALLEVIRPIGMECENDMLKATGGVNTHKGIIFSMGILCAAVGTLYREYHKENMRAEDACSKAALICTGIVERDFNKIDKRPILTHGERLYMEYGISGIRGEVEGGFKTVLEKGMCVLRNEGIRNTLSVNDMLLHTLMNIMTCCQDTNVLIRGRLDGLKLVQSSAEEFMASGGMLSKNGKSRLQDMDRIFIERNVSPGGSADLLSVSLFLAEIEGISL